MEFDLHRLRLLRELSFRGTIAAVAAALNYNPASVSQQLGQLQRELGTRLIEPDGRGVRLTPAAHVLVAHVEAVFGRLELAEADLARSGDEVIGTVRIAAFQTVLLSVIPRTLSLLAAQHPGLRIEIFEAESELARSRLLPRDFDLVIDEVYPGHPLARSEHLSQHLLYTDPMRLAHAQSLNTSRSRGAAPTALADFADAPWAMEPHGSPAREWSVATCRAAGFEPEIRFESSDVIVHERLVATGHAVAFLPDTLAAENGSPTIRIRLSAEHQRRVVATTRGVADRHPALIAALDALRVAANELLDIAHTARACES